MEPANEKSQRKVLVFIVYTLIIILTLISSMMLFYPRFPLHKWPHAVFVYSPIMPIIYENVTFDASHSFDPDGWIMRYRWDFGDGIVSVENRSIVNHVFSEFGIRKVTLTVTDNNNLTDSISDTLTVRKLPIARFVYSPVILYVGDEVLFDASASTPEGGYIVSYNWDFGDGGTTLTRESCVTHVYPRSGTYEVTLTITDSEELRDEKSKTLMVVKGAVIDIYTKYPSPFGGQGLGNPSDGFSPQDHVILYANVTFNKIPVEDEFVVFEVRDPSSTIFIYRTAVTNSFGVAALSFTIPWYGNITEVISGMWSTFASVEVLGEKVNDTLTFPVHWLVELVGLETCDYDGDAKASFMKGESIYFQVHLRNIALVRKNVTITISIYDELNVPVGSSVLEYFIVPPRSYTIFITDLQIPKWAFIGNATAHVNALSSPPDKGGIVYCPERSVSFYSEHGTPTPFIPPPPQGWLVELVGLETCDYDGDAKASFMKGESIYFQVHLRNIALVRKNVTITISIYDELNVPVGSSVLEYFIVPPRSYTIFITDLQVSKRAFIGNATAHVSAFSRLPVECGIPYCPEISDVFVITRHP